MGGCSTLGWVRTGKEEGVKGSRGAGEMCSQRQGSKGIMDRHSFYTAIAQSVKSLDGCTSVLQSMITLNGSTSDRQSCVTRATIHKLYTCVFKVSLCIEGDRKKFLLGG
jgi:hypothetical protein